MFKFNRNKRLVMVSEEHCGDLTEKYFTTLDRVEDQYGHHYDTGDGRVLFEEARTDPPKPWFFRIRIRSKGPDGWRQTSDRRFIGDAGAKLYADSLEGAERSSPGRGITRIVAPAPGFKDVEWDVTYTDKEALAPSLNVKPFPRFPEIDCLECGECGSTNCEPMRRESTGSILCRCWSCGDWFYVYPEEL